MAEVYGYTGMLNPAKDESRLGTGWFGDGPPIMGYMPPSGGSGVLPDYTFPDIFGAPKTGVPEVPGAGGAFTSYMFPDIFDKPSPTLDLTAFRGPTLSMGGPAMAPPLRGDMPPVGPIGGGGPVAEYSGTIRPGAMGGFKPDALVNMIGGAAESTGLGGLLKSMFPDAWYDIGEAMKGKRPASAPSAPARPTPSQTYAAANQASRDRAIASSSNPERNSARASLASQWGFD
jgi:hypothetical protein